MALTWARRRMIWILGTIALLAAGLVGTWHYAMNNNAVALLDGIDRMVGGTSGTRTALANARYGPLEAQRIEVIVPDALSSTPRPVIVFIHGGGWHSGVPGEYHFLGRTFARAGYVVVLAGYRMVPEGAYPRMLEDSAAAIAWTREHLGEFGGDQARVFLMGHSAGAYNVVMLSLDRQWLDRAGVPKDFVKGVIGLSGPYDFYPFTSDSARAAFAHVADPALTQPIHFARGDAPPMLLLTGDADTTVKPRNSRALARALTAAGRPTEPVVLPGVDHAGPILKLAHPFLRDRRVIDPILAFLAAHGAASAPVQASSR